jgi:FkbM family methyltransferase
LLLPEGCNKLSLIRMGASIEKVDALLSKIRKALKLARLLGVAQSIYVGVQRLRGAQQVVALKVLGVRTPLFCRTSSSDIFVLWQVFGKRHLEIPLQGSPQLIVDGGANVGYSSIYFAEKYPDAQIIAVEPDPENCALFRKNCSVYPNIELIQGALWTASTDLVIQNPTAESWAFRVVGASSPRDDSFKGFTITEVLMYSGKQHIDLLKLDVEGSEEQLFSSDFEGWINRVKTLMIELHGQRCYDAVFAATKDQGFTVSQSSGEYVIFTTSSVATTKSISRAQHA